jgi:putative ABC transport system substrate-binding protein
MKRREFLGLVGGVAAGAWPVMARGQQIPGVPVIGFLHPGFPESTQPVFAAMRDGLRAVGYVEGKTVKFEARWANGQPEILAQLAKELVQSRVDILIAVGRSAIVAAREATSTLPIVATDLESDPVASGFVASLAKPGGNLTGLFLDAPTLCGKWLEQLTDIVPALAKAAVLWDATTGTYQLDAIKAAAKAMSIGLVIMEFRDAGGINDAIENGLKQNPQAVIQLGSPLINQLAKLVAEALATHRVPSISQFRSFPVSGGLISYGPDLTSMFLRVAPYVFKLLHGARPSDLPVERPTKFELVVNLKTAKGLGLTVPPSLLARADEVIE